MSADVRCESIPEADRAPLLARLYAKTDVRGASDCWLWQGFLGTGGYATIRYRGRGLRVHRAMLLVRGETIPAGMVVDHMCRVRHCLNPYHLRIVTPRINSIENSVGPTAKKAAMTHCQNGHEFTEENTKLTPRGNGMLRSCRLCNREYQRVWKSEFRARTGRR